MRQFRSLGLLSAAIVCAGLVVWTSTSAYSSSRNAAVKPSFSIALPLVIQLAPGELWNASPQPAVGETATPTATATATSTASPTLTPSAAPTNTPECEQDLKQNLRVHFLAPNSVEVTNSSANCTYAVGLASYRMFDTNLSHQQLFAWQTAQLGSGETQIFTVELPGCAYQLDLFYGPLIERFDPQHGQIYGDRILATRVVRDAGLCAPGTPTPTSFSTPSATAVGGSPSPTITPTAMNTPSPTATSTPGSDTPTPTQGGT